MQKIVFQLCHCRIAIDVIARICQQLGIFRHDEYFLADGAQHVDKLLEAFFVIIFAYGRFLTRNSSSVSRIMNRSNI